ncbi:MAG: AAA family ATPase [Candidatus Binatia bacterium]|nr:AAA family ATPase [Candidatus Binatia bacterium]
MQEPAGSKEHEQAASTAEPQLPGFIRAMLEPSFYPHRPPWVRLEQTHISYVLLAPPVVYKVKKPVRFRFLDFSTRDLRRRFCEQEVRLNRRLAPNVYRRVVAIVREATQFRLAPVETAPAAVEDYAVEMEYLPDDLRLDRLLLSGRVQNEFIDELARLLAQFHRSAGSGPSVVRFGAPEELAATWQENFADTEIMRGELIHEHDDEQIRAFVERFLRDNDTVLRRRQAEERIRDGHGDLHADHVYATHPPAIIDCIEFSDRLRCCDVASDVAFLAVDFDFFERRDLHDRFLLAYNAVMADHDLPRLLPFYKCYRAYVRGKVEGLKSRESDVPEAERARACSLAKRRFTLAYRYTWEPLRAIVALAGPSGTGKSTLASLLAERTGFHWIRSDVVRKELAGREATQKSAAPFGQGIYSADITARTYAELRHRALHLFDRGQGSILDATHLHREQRDILRAAAEKFQAPLLFVWCTCPEDEIQRRLEARATKADEPSDADWGIYLRQREKQELPGEDEPDVLFVDMTVPPMAAAMQVEDLLRKRAVPVPLVSPLAPRLPLPFP